jgi:hypothetical protein
VVPILSRTVGALSSLNRALSINAHLSSKVKRYMPNAFTQVGELCSLLSHPRSHPPTNLDNKLSSSLFFISSLADPPGGDFVPHSSAWMGMALIIGRNFDTQTNDSNGATDDRNSTTRRSYEQYGNTDRAYGGQRLQVEIGTPYCHRDRQIPPPSPNRQTWIWIEMTSHRHLDIGHWTLDTGHWTLDTGHWTLDTGHWTLDIGRKCWAFVAIW